MNLLYLVPLLMFLGTLGTCKKSNEETWIDILSKHHDYVEHYNAIKSNLRHSCQKEGGEELFKKLNKVFKNLDDSFRTLFPNTAKELEEGKSFCSAKRPQLQERLQDVASIWKECTTKDEYKDYFFLPDFLFDAIKSIFDYYCTDEKTIFRGLMNSAQCVNKLTEHELMDQNFGNVCSNHLESLNNQDLHVPKRYMCAELEIMDTCYGKHIKKECPGSDFIKLFSGVLGAIPTAACDGEE